MMMLAFQPRDQIGEWLRVAVLAPFTPHAITDAEQLLADIELARANGYALLEQQLQSGVRGIAIPLLNRSGELVAALSVSIPMAGESADAALARVLPVPQETANALVNHL